VAGFQFTVKLCAAKRLAGEGGSRGGDGGGVITLHLGRGETHAPRRLRGELTIKGGRSVGKEGNWKPSSRVNVDTLHHKKKTPPAPNSIKGKVSQISPEVT